MPHFPRRMLLGLPLMALTACGSGSIIDRPTFAEMDADLTSLHAAADGLAVASVLPTGSVDYSGIVGFSYLSNDPAEIVANPYALGIVDVSIPFSGGGSFTGYVGNVLRTDGGAFPPDFVMTGNRNGTDLTAALTDGADDPMAFILTGDLLGAGATHATMTGVGGQDGDDPIHAYMVLGRD